MPESRKRRLTKEEIVAIKSWVSNAPIGKKPTIRQIAKAFGVNRPSVLKSLGGWKPKEVVKPKFPVPKMTHKPESIIKPAQFSVPKELRER